MRIFRVIRIAALVILGAPLLAQEPTPRGDVWTRSLADRGQRSSLHDRSQYVRGDSGKWQDEPVLVHAPPIAQKPIQVSLDEKVDELLERKIPPASADDNWLLFRTRQLNDNDRVWVERIERRGNQFTIVVNEAVWQGRYSKNFTYYAVIGVNVGKLEPAKYEAQCRFTPLMFRQFEGTGQPNEIWPKDERPTEKKAIELRIPFSVSPHNQPD